MSAAATTPAATSCSLTRFGTAACDQALKLSGNLRNFVVRQLNISDRAVDFITADPSAGTAKKVASFVTTLILSLALSPFALVVCAAKKAYSIGACAATKISDFAKSLWKKPEPAQAT